MRPLTRSPPTTSSACSTSSRIPRAATTARRFAIRRRVGGAPRRLDRHLFPAARRRGVALASGRCRRGLALVRRRAAGARPWPTRHGRRDVTARAPISPPASARRRWCRPRAWQQATSLGAWTLVGCTVAPGFEFAGFELAPPGFEPAVKRASSTPARRGIARHSLRSSTAYPRLPTRDIRRQAPDRPRVYVDERRRARACGHDLQTCSGANL